MTKRSFRPFVTAVGTAKWPKINEPDTKGQYADGKYKLNVVFDEEDTKALKKHLADIAAEIAPEVSNPRLPIHTDKKDGSISFVFKKKNKPLVIDTKRAKLPEGVKIGGGSKVRIGYTLMNYDKGITALLDCVQVVELREGFDINSMPADEDGYEAPTDADESSVADRFADTTTGDDVSGAEAAKDKKFAL